MEGSAYMGYAEAHHGGARLQGEHGRAGCTTGRTCSTTRSPPRSTRRSCAALIVESIDPEGPYGAKEAGEGPLHPSIPAIANAIYDAVGVRIDRLPFSPPRVSRALRQQEESAPKRTVEVVAG